MMENSITRRSVLSGAVAAAGAALAGQVAVGQQASLTLAKVEGAKPRNIILILTDDHRYDAMGFMGHPFLKTPNLDALAKGGVHFANAFVSTALCSPSRATILTSLYAHQHKVVDNNNPFPKGTVLFPQYLQAAGYETAFFGKWHMGGAGGERPQPGFDHWVSFPGQGTYLPSAGQFNINGQKVPQKGYITDELTDYCIEWLNGRKGDKPFFVSLAHKGVHAEFIPAERHKGAYKDAKFAPPATQANTEENYRGKPMWVKNQRNSWHGVDYPYHSDLDIGEYHKRYCETFLAVDESIGRIVEWLKQKNLLDSTLILYMGDNGFLFGEHGLIDKRCAYEESMRIPMVMHCPEISGSGGRKVTRLASNLDVAPTFLDAAGLKAPAHMMGRSLLPLAAGKDVQWHDHVLYEYYWERNFPHTPTMHAIRTEQYKYIHYHGVWDTDELYDLSSDPRETTNLINSKEHAALVQRLKKQMFDELDATAGMYIPLYRDSGGQQNLRRKGGSEAGEFPAEMLREK